jgi:hypothetical protein
MYPPPGVSTAMLAEIERFEGMAGNVLGTGFGGLFGSLALGLAATDGHALAAGILLGAAVASGLAATLSCYGLTCSFETHDAWTVYARKWIGANCAVGVLLAAVLLGLLSAFVLLV